MSETITIGGAPTKWVTVITPFLVIALVLALGVAAEKRVVDGPRPDASLAYWRDGDNVHHVPKRPLSELIVGRF